MGGESRVQAFVRRGLVREIQLPDANGVAFDQETVPAAIEEGTLLFAVGLRVTKPGKHPINGLFRVGYLHTDEIAMVSLRLIATVTGTE